MPLMGLIISRSGIFLRSWNKGIFQNRYPEQDRTRIRQDISPSARLYRIGRCGLQVGGDEISDCHQSQVFHGGCGPDHVLDCFHEFRDRVGIVTNPKYSMEDVDQTTFSIAFTNSETGWGWVASNLIDGEAGNGVTSAWSSKYDGDLASDDYDDFVYNFDPIERWVHHPDYPFCERCRALSDTYIVIDMKEDITLGAVGFGKWSDEWGDRVLKDCRVDLADEFIFRTVQDGGTAADYTDVSNGTVGWKEAFDCKGMSQDKAACQWFTVSDTEGATLQSGRYMRLNTYGTSHPGNPYCAAFTEIYVKKVVAVDGVRLE